MSTRYIVRFGLDYPNGGSASGALIRAPRSRDEFPYPQVVGDVTLGPLDDNLSSSGAEGWVSGNDEAVRGFWNRLNADPAGSFRIDAPDGPGTYRVWYGTAVDYTPRWRHRIADGVGGAVRSDVSYVGGTGYPSDAALDADAPNGPVWRQWVDHAGVVRAMSSDVFAAISEPLEVEVSSGSLVITNGGHASGAFRSRLSFIAFEKVSGAPPIPPAADTIRFQDGAAPPWAPAAGPTVGVPYTLIVEAWDSVLLDRDIAITGSVTIDTIPIVSPNIVITGGSTTQPWINGLATFTNIVFGESGSNPPEPPPLQPTQSGSIPVVFRIGGITPFIIRPCGANQFIARSSL